MTRGKLRIPFLVVLLMAPPWANTDVPRPDLPEMAAEVARADGIVDAAVIGDRARTIEPGPPTLEGDQADHPLQWVKHLWQALVVFGDDTRPTSPISRD